MTRTTTTGLLRCWIADVTPDSRPAPTGTVAIDQRSGELPAGSTTDGQLHPPVSDSTSVLPRSTIFCWRFRPGRGRVNAVSARGCAEPPIRHA